VLAHPSPSLPPYVLLLTGFVRSPPPRHATQQFEPTEACTGYTETHAEPQRTLNSSRPIHAGLADVYVELKRLERSTSVPKAAEILETQAAVVLKKLHARLPNSGPTNAIFDKVRDARGSSEDSRATSIDKVTCPGAESG
jgi:hypothetical protein